jgi:exo-beta-1,3-glucanase (GH17 family)
MKGSTFAAAAAAMAGSAAAARLHHRHAGAHELFRKDDGSMCLPECTTIYSTFYGEPTLHLSPAPAPSSTAPAAVVESSPAPTEPAVVAPTPTPVTVTEPGTYTIPGTTVTLTEPTTVLGVTTTHLPPGTHTIGGVTTVVPGPTTVTVPVAVVTPGTDNVPTSTLSSTIYVCPSAGTYTVGPITTTVPTEGDVEYPFPTEYPAGTYTRPEVVTTITLQSTVFYCPYTSSGAVEPTPEPVAPTTAAPVAPTTTAAPEAPTTAAPVVTKEPEVSSVVTPPASSVASSTPVKSTTPQAPTGGLGGGSWFAMTYTPYTSDKVSQCKDKATIRSDIKAFADAGFLGVRVYSTECDTLPNVGDAAKEFGLKLIIGVFVKDDGCTYETETIKDQVDAMVAWADWDNVAAIVVGNEARLSGKCSTDQLATLFTVVKEKTQAVGYTGAYTVAETTNVWQDTTFSGVMCDLVDITGGNIHPYFNPETSADNAGKFVKGQLDILDAICSGKTSFNLECGWPKSGICNGLACPGESEQAAALASIVSECGSRTVFFSSTDDLWKEPGDCGCENSWGCGSLFESSSFTARV